MGKTERKRIKVSKNKKRNWNRHCDIKDVEDFLEDTRTEERLGGLISEKRDDELFCISTNENDDAIKPKESQGFLRCHQNLYTFSSVPTPIKPLKGGQPKGSLPKAFRKKKKASVPVEKKKKSDDPEFCDLWAESEKNVKVDPEIADLVEYNEIFHKKPVKVPCYRYQKPSLLPPVEVPHPGASYNPSFDDHQDLLREAVKIEEAKIKEELHLKRVLLDMFPTRANAPTKETWMQEMSQGLFDKAEDGSDEDSSTELTINPPVTTDNQKSRQKRRRKLELKIQERNRLREKARKKEMHEVFRLRSIAAEIKKKEKAIAEGIKRKEKREAEKMFKPRTLSAHKYEPNDLEVNLTDELQGSLRCMKTEGNLLEDRYKSLQRRNIIEARVKQKFKRKYKLRFQVKRSHRDFK